MFHCFRYFCLPGYQINDRQDYNITCGKGGSWVSTWSTSDFHPASCQPVLCVGSPPPPIPNSAWVKGIDPSSSATTGDVGFLHHKLRLMLLRAYWLQMHRQSKQWLLNIPKGFPFYTNMTSFSYPYNCDSLHLPMKSMCLMNMLQPIRRMKLYRCFCTYNSGTASSHVYLCFIGQYLDTAEYRCYDGYQVHTRNSSDITPVQLTYSFTCGANNDWKDEYSPDYCIKQSCGDPGKV